MAFFHFHLNFQTVKKLLSVVLIIIFIGFALLTVSISSDQIRHFRVIDNMLEPPIYPKPGQEYSSICNVSLTSSKFKFDKTLPLIYFITPTYTRREQIAEMTRLGQTLLNVPNLHWIVSEDADFCSPMIEALLQRFDLPYTHIISPMPKMYNVKTDWAKPRGVSGRRAAMQWIVENWRQKSVLYFGDDDNTYDLRLFEDIRKTKKVSVFPVALVSAQAISTPVVETQEIQGLDGKMMSVNKVVGFSDAWQGNRKFAMDMAGFAVNVEFLASNENASMPYKAAYEEDLFIQSLNVSMDDLEPLANGCTQVLVWHTKTANVKTPSIKDEKTFDTNLHLLLRELSHKGIVKVSNLGKELNVCRQVSGCK